MTACITILSVICAVLGGSLYGDIPFAPVHGTETPQNDVVVGTLPANTDHSAVSTSHNAGKITSEGVHIIGSDAVNHDGHTGKGIRVAVIDAGFDIDNPEIAGNIAGYRSFIADRDIRGFDTTHGTAAAEIIVDIAPDAELYLYSAYTDVEFLNLADYLLSRGDIDIISMSYGWYNDVGPIDGTNKLAQKVNEVRDNNILFVTSAGNFAQQHWQGQFSDTDGDSWHNFQDGGQTVDIDVNFGAVLKIVLSWWDSPLQDFDLCLYENDVELTCSTNSQSEFLPYEIVEYIFPYSTTVQVAIKKTNADEDVHFQMFSSHELNQYAVASSSLGTPADSAGSLSVGAVNLLDGGLEAYSSQGPTLDGRIKPDIVAPACVNSTAYGEIGFCGTSGAAPHVSGAAALVMEKYPDATADQVQILLESTTSNRHAKSNQDGTGTLDVSMFAGSDILALDNSNPDCNPCFFPDILRVAAMDTVTWVNADNTALRIAGDFCTELFDSGNLARGETYSKTYNERGTFGYSDMQHPWATGGVAVTKSIIPFLVSAAVTDSNQITMIFSDIAVAAPSDFANLQLTPGGSRTVSSVAGSGTEKVILTFDGEPVSTDATATVDVSVAGASGSPLVEYSELHVEDGQAPVLESVSITSSNANPNFTGTGDFITLEFTASEEIVCLEVTINRNDSVFSIVRDNTWNATKVINSAERFGPVTFTVNFYDLAGNAGRQVDSTTDGSSVSVAKSSTNTAFVTGTVFSDINGNGKQDVDEGGIEGYRMLAIDYDTAQVKEAYTTADGTYMFDINTAPATTLLQTWYYPQGHTVFDPKASWFLYAHPMGGDVVEFNVGFHPVSPEEQVTLDVLAYRDDNFNGQMDSDEQGVEGLTQFYVHTYTIGPVALPPTDSAGAASVTDLVYADFALLVFVDHLAESGYIWTSTNYERDDTDEYDPTLPIAVSPQQGSTHNMRIGLVPLS